MSDAGITDYFYAESSYVSDGDATAAARGHQTPTPTPPLNFIVEVSAPEGGPQSPTVAIEFRKRLYQVDQIVLMPLQPPREGDPAKEWRTVKVIPKKLLIDCGTKLDPRQAVRSIFVDDVEYKQVERPRLKRTCSPQIYPRSIRIGDVVFYRHDAIEEPSKPRDTHVVEGTLYIRDDLIPDSCRLESLKGETLRTPKPPESINTEEGTFLRFDLWAARAQKAQGK